MTISPKEAEFDVPVERILQPQPPEEAALGSGLPSPPMSTAEAPPDEKFPPAVPEAPPTLSMMTG